MGVAGAAGELDGFGEVHADFGGGVGVGGEGDGNTESEGELDDGGTGIDFFAIFAQAGGVEFHSEAVAFGRLQKAGEEGSAVLLRIKAKFLAEVCMGDDVE